MCEKHVPSGLVAPKESDEVKGEYVRQSKYLEQSVAAIRKKVDRDEAANRAESLRIMQHNMRLIQEISALRSEVQKLKARRQEVRLEKHRPGGDSKAASGGGGGTAGSGAPSAAALKAARARELLTQVNEAEAEEQKLTEAAKMLEQALILAKPVSAAGVAGTT